VEGCFEEKPPSSYRHSHEQQEGTSSLLPHDTEPHPTEQRKMPDVAPPAKKKRRRSVIVSWDPVGTYMLELLFRWRLERWCELMS
jgi:hypothetical protein